MKRGGIQGDSGQPVNIINSAGENKTCYRENLEEAERPCPKGWYGNTEKGFCFKVFTKQDTNMEATR